MRYTVALLIAFLSSALPICAQAVYKVEFEVNRGSGSAKHYTLLTDESGKGFLQAGDRVSGNGSPIDVGATIRCTVREEGGNVALQGNIEISSIAGTAFGEPIIRQAKLSFDSVLQMKVPAVVVNERKAVAAPVSEPLAIGQVEATVTRVE